MDGITYPCEENWNFKKHQNSIKFFIEKIYIEQ